MNNNSLIDRLKHAAVPLIVVVGLGTSACSGDDDNSNSNTSTIEGEITSTFNRVGELCLVRASELYGEKYPPVIIDADPTAEELREALEVTEERELNGAAFAEEAFKDCMDSHFYDVVEGLELPQFNNNGADAVAPATTIQGN